MLKRHGPAVAAYVGATALMLWPLLGAFGSRVLGEEYDNMFFIRQVWWMKYAVVDLRTSPFFDASSYYPLGYDLGRGAYAPASTIPAIPLTWAASPVISYNAIVVGSFLLTALGTYAWMLRLTRRRTGAFFAGLVAAMLPYRFGHIFHLNLLTTQWIPWTLWAFETYLARPSNGRTLSVGTLAALIALSDWYYGYAAALLLPIYFALRFRSNRVVDWAIGVRHTALAGSGALLLVLPFLLDSLRLWKSHVIGGHGLQPAFFDLNPYDPFVPNLRHPIWGKALARVFEWQGTFWAERCVTLGYVAIGLAALGLRR